MAAVEIFERMLAGVVFEDAATRMPVRHPLHVDADGVSFFRNRRHIYAVRRASGLEAHSEAVEAAPAAPPVGSVHFDVEVRDPSGMYLPRRFALDLPRSSDPANPDAAVRPLVVQLFRSPNAPRSLHWAVVRVRLEDAAGEPVPAALLRVVFAPAEPLPQPEILGMGMSVVDDPRARELARRFAPINRWVHFDRRHVGEACVPVVGLSSTIWSDSADGDQVSLAEVPVALEVLPIATAGGLPDPDPSVEATVDAANRIEFSLSVGQELLAGQFEVTL